MPSTPRLSCLSTLLRRPALAALLCVTTLSSAQAPDASADYAVRVLAAVNAYRQTKGLPALQHSPALAVLAAEHSAAMARQRRPSHDGFALRFERSGSELCVENVAQGFRQPEQVVHGWRAVQTHHRNMLDPKVRSAGVASAGAFVTYFACE
ncbi:CAP domain-containing protein [Aquincola sp. S2]|uniref:CAP domain-containing protein n=1 Tax=Pseudaquabacterium terrae TaxID=2732868 RepID=A0ABX2ENS4_9BURK|nr:CAP domain-containing protein [Aquabacterium terrae]NRF70339.1 CAP domain-containing protein [Aquabacterium terrae]